MLAKLTNEVNVAEVNSIGFGIGGRRGRGSTRGRLRAGW